MYNISFIYLSRMQIYSQCKTKLAKQTNANNGRKCLEIEICKNCVAKTEPAFLNGVSHIKIVSVVKEI